jgi:hypothetical protein
MKATIPTTAAKGAAKPDDGEKKYPLFLNKTFAMLKTSSPEIATWAEDGLSFYIIDQTRFVDSVIPQYFKHSNFSSFVRQLNFYGFRKVWSDQLIEMVRSIMTIAPFFLSFVLYTTFLYSALIFFYSNKVATRRC